MEQKDYYAELVNLHRQIVADIEALMIEHKKAVVDLAGSPAPHAFIVGVPDFDWDMDYVEAEVLEVILENGEVKFDINWNIDSDAYFDSCPNSNGDISDLYAIVDAKSKDKLLPCAGMDSVYDAVYEYLTYHYKGDKDEDMK
jgi:hypothetical protein